jgi:hypothetical protein
MTVDAFQGLAVSSTFYPRLKRAGRRGLFVRTYATPATVAAFVASSVRSSETVIARFSDLPDGVALVEAALLHLFGIDTAKLCLEG